MRLKITILTVVLALAATASAANKNKPAAAETPLASKGVGPIFHIDYTNLRGVEDRTFVEFYFQVSHDQLQFIKLKDEERFEARYSLEIMVYDQNDRVVESHAVLDKIRVDSFRATTATDRAQICLIGFTFDPGLYRIHAVLTDFETEDASTIDEWFLAEDFRAPKLLLSDIQLSPRIKPAPDGEPYVKNQRYIEPTAIRTFAHGFSDLYVYFEVYNLKFSVSKSASTYTSTFVFFNSTGEKIAQFERHTRKPGPVSAHSLKLPVEYFNVGDYTLLLTVRDDETGEKDYAQETFRVVDQAYVLNSTEYSIPPR